MCVCMYACKHVCMSMDGWMDGGREGGMCVCAYMYVFVSRDLGLGLARSLGSDDWLEVTVRSL